MLTPGAAAEVLGSPPDFSREGGANGGVLRDNPASLRRCPRSDVLRPLSAMLKRTLAAALAALLSVPTPAQTPDLYDIEVIRDVYITFAQSNWWQLLLQNYAAEINIPANMTVDGVTYPNVGVRFRGNSSYFQLPPTSEKRSLNIETDAYVPGQDLYGYEHLNFNNGFHDPTFLREFLTYWVMRRHGPAPLCNFVRVHLNGTYWGVFINVQQPNKDMMRLWWRSNDGNRYRGFPTSGSFGNGRCAYTWLGTDVNQYLSAYQAKQGDGTDLMQMCNVLNNTPSNQLQALLPAWFNVDQFYRYIAVMNVTTQDDSYIGSGKDHFAYHDAIHGDFHVFPFDLNESMAAASNYDIWRNTTSTIKPGLSKTLVFPDWRERYKSHVRTVVEETFNYALMGPMAQRFHTTLTPMVTADTKKIYSTTLFLNNLTQSVSLGGIGGNTIPGVLPFIQGREAFLRTHADLSQPRTVLTALGHAPASPLPSQQITVTVTASSHAAAVRLYWRKFGPFSSTPMFDDGAHGDGAANDGVFGAFIAGQAPGSLIDYYVEASTASGLATYSPPTAEQFARQFMVAWPTGTSPIRINEFMAQNTSGLRDENNQYEDWVELYNTSNQAVNVGGMWVTDDITRPKFQIPANFAIPAFGTMLIWCDEDGTQGPLHANFKLSSGGEDLALFAADGITLLESMSFGLQVADVSTGRYLDGGLPWVTFKASTGNARNELAGCGVRGYSALDSRANASTLALTGSPRIGTSPTLSITGAPASGLGALFFAAGPAHIDLTPFSLPGEVLLLDALSLVGPFYLPLDASGTANTALAIPAAAHLVGVGLNLQVIGANGTAVDGSTALQIVICP